jgi:DNA polymerase-3 subunit beta
LLDTLKAFPEQPLTFNVDNKHFGVEIVSDQGSYKMTGFSGAEFPKTPSLEDPASFTIPAGTLATAISKTIFATGNDDLRPVMSGIFFELSEEAVRFVATDAHKLVRYTRSDIASPRTASFIVPKKPLTLMRNTLGATNAEVTVEFNENNASFTFDNVRMVCRLIDGKYPNYEAVIPQQNPNKLTMDRQGFLNSIRRVALFSNKTTHQVRLAIAGSQLAISAEDLDFANEANEKLTCKYEGEDMTIGFNSRFLMDMLTNLDSEHVVLEMSAPNRAGILLPSEGSEHGEDVLMLVMPVMLNN